ncbi:hypothetical protein MLD38_022739 [Melastoma candidum]|uniref:Uncharacterized protein n=1 Tax=Melastoma candidum TaxID=119954 RepID=A0ACB9QM36_9MYRT|nr:hypothetical protein MLD38_022739 [Melastoma candidum]
MSSEKIATQVISNLYHAFIAKVPRGHMTLLLGIVFFGSYLCFTFESAKQNSGSFSIAVEDPTIKECFPVSTISVTGLPILKVLDVQSNEVGINAPAFQRLCLTEASVDDDMIGSVITKCPLLEDDELVKPSGLHQLTIQGFLKVDSLDLFV